jgi:hypothetical protein
MLEASKDALSNSIDVNIKKEKTPVDNFRTDQIFAFQNNKIKDGNNIVIEVDLNPNVKPIIPVKNRLRK